MFRFCFDSAIVLIVFCYKRMVDGDSGMTRILTSTVRYVKESWLQREYCVVLFVSLWIDIERGLSMAVNGCC